MKPTLYLVLFVCMFSPAVAQTQETAPPAALGPAALLALTPALRFDGPLAFCNEPVPLDQQDVREALEKEMLLALWDRAQVVLWLKRSGRFLPVIEKELRDHGLPADLKYVAVVESALLPHAGSPAGAVGFWQFLAGTGRSCGLTVDEVRDERSNIFASTRAACQHLSELHNSLGSWTLVAVAYNLGEKNLRDEMIQQEMRDFYKLYLPQETTRYVFKILAVKLILADPARYGFDISAQDLYPALEFERVTFSCPAGLPIRLVAKAASTYYKKIKDLNPELRGRSLDAGTHTLAVPAGATEGFASRLEPLLKEWQQAQPGSIYIVRAGDSPSSIAARFNISMTLLLRANHLDPQSQIHPGQQLIISR